MRRLLGVVLVIGCALSAAGCGSGAGGAEAAALTVIGTEMAFEAPASVPADDYVVTFRNDGAVAHELALADPTGKVVTRRSIGAGQSVELDVALTPGRWELGCFEPGHFASGMHRPLEVTPRR